MTIDADQARQCSRSQNTDYDPVETSDWLASLDSLFRSTSPDRARFLLSRLDERAKELGVISDAPPYSPYRNSIALEAQPPFPGDIDMETRITAIIKRAPTSTVSAKTAM